MKSIVLYIEKVKKNCKENQKYAILHVHNKRCKEKLCFFINYLFFWSTFLLKKKQTKILGSI